MADYDHLADPRRKEIERAILARLEAKSDHDYQWPRWAAADEASHAVMALLFGNEQPKPTARPAHPATMIGRGNAHPE